VPPGGPHAEVEALAQPPADDARGATAYVTLEPCNHRGRTGPCSDALIAAGVARVVVRPRADPHPRTGGAAARHGCASRGHRAVDSGLLEAEAKALVNAGFLASPPHAAAAGVRAKLASSLDGRTAMASGDQPVDHRARPPGPTCSACAPLAGAIVTGSRHAARRTTPALTVREFEGPLRAHRAFLEAHPPLRVVVGRRGPRPGSRLLEAPGPVLWARPADGPGAPGGEGAPRTEGAPRPEVVALPAGGDGRVDPGALLDLLGAREVNDVLVEAGPTLAGAFLAAGLVDELVVYLAPRLLGDGGRPLAHLPALRSLDDALPLRWTDVAVVGTDVRLTAVPADA
jgi:diaminohydroxyphosphoribosylaminopyrimidine deaminase/5-amino-6-(5-phosphoribosylamino)uracil reductase